MRATVRRVVVLFMMVSMMLGVFCMIAGEHAHAEMVSGLPDREASRLALGKTILSMHNDPMRLLDDEIDYWDYCVENGAGVDYAKKLSVFYMKGGDFSPNAYYFYMGAKAKNAKRIKVCTSNPKVAIGTYAEFWPGGFVTQKAGKATLTIKILTKKNKVKRYKCKLTVKKYANPFKEVTFAGKDLAKKFNKTRYKSANIKAVDGKFKVKVKKGWKLVQVFFDPLYKGEEEITDKSAYKGRYIKSGEVIDLPTDISDNCIDFYIMVRRKKTGEERVWLLTVNPFDDEE